MDVDVVVLSSGLTESIAAAALSKAGYKVAHLDVNPYYGGDNASLTIDELVIWADERAGDASSTSYVSAQRSKFTSISKSGMSLPQSRQYSISLSPTIIPSIGPLIDALIASGVSRYGGFKLLEKVAIYTGPGSVKPVPGSKEDVFKNKELSLLEKRRLMRFLMFAAGDFESKKELEGKEGSPFIDFLRDTFSLDGDTTAAIAYALAFCTSGTDSTLPALQRIRRYLRSTGRYGPSPFLVGHYGGLGEIAQGFCRTAAVSGATYILGHNVSSVQTSGDGAADRKYKIELEGLEETLTCDLIITSPGYPSPEEPSTVAGTSGHPTSSPGYPVARAAAILDRPLTFSSPEAPQEGATDLAVPDEAEAELTEDQSPQRQELDTALLVFPPSSVPGGSAQAAANALFTGEGSMSSPRGRWILYLSLPLLDATTTSAEALLRPYLDATLTLAIKDAAAPAPLNPLFTVFYIEHSDAQADATATPSPSVLRAAPSSTLISEQADSSTVSAEALFWKSVEALKAADRRPKRKPEDGEEMGEDVEVEVDSFWPPLDILDDPSEEW